MDYGKIYIKLIYKAKKRTTTEKYEIHHIIPRCIGGDDSPSNLIPLTFREHFIAHKLLYKMFSGDDKLFFAYKMMCHRNKNSRDYERNRDEFSKRNSIAIKNSYAQKRGYLSYWHICDVIWLMRYYEEEKVKDISYILDLPENYVLRCINWKVQDEGLEEQYYDLKFKQRSENSRDARLNESTTQRRKRIVNMTKTKNTSEFKARISQQRKFGGNPSAQPVVIDGVEFGSMSHAAEILKLKTHVIRYRVCSELYPNYRRKNVITK